MILIAPHARAMRNGKPHPKEYPYWDELLELLKDKEIVQVGVASEVALVPDFRPNLPLSELAKLIAMCETWIAIDSFFQHFCWSLGKPGIVLFGQSDPLIFGHPENVNLLKDRSYLRERQFWQWEQAENRPEAFVEPIRIIEILP